MKFAVGVSTRPPSFRPDAIEALLEQNMPNSKKDIRKVRCAEAKYYSKCAVPIVNAMYPS